MPGTTNKKKTKNYIDVIKINKDDYLENIRNSNILPSNEFSENTDQPNIDRVEGDDEGETYIVDIENPHEIIEDDLQSDDLSSVFRESKKFEQQKNISDAKKIQEEIKRIMDSDAPEYDKSKLIDTPAYQEKDEDEETKNSIEDLENFEF